MKDYFIYNEITDRTATDFAAFLNGTQGEITLHINSAGGDIFSAIAISNLIKRRGNVQICVDGLCASAATLICCAGNVTAAKNAMFMLHLPLAGLTDFYYNAEELAKVQNSLISITDALIETYGAKLNTTKDALMLALKNETWLNATEAQKLGLVDEISGEEVEMQMATDVLFVNKVPFTNIKNLPAENVNRVTVAEKLMKSVLVAERGRVAELNALKTKSPARNSIINKAIETGKTADEIKPFLDALPVEEKPKFEVDELYKMLKDNVTSGASEVEGSTPRPETKDEMAAFSDSVAKFANEMLKGGFK